LASCYGPVSIDLSVTSLSSIKMAAKHTFIMQTALCGNVRTRVFFCCQKSWWNSSWVTNTCGYNKFAAFWHYLEMIEDRWIISVKSKHEVTCGVSNGDIADNLEWPNHPKTLLFLDFWSFFVSLEWLKLESSNFVHSRPYHAGDEKLLRKWMWSGSCDSCLIVGAPDRWN